MPGGERDEKLGGLVLGIVAANRRQTALDSPHARGQRIEERGQLEQRCVLRRLGKRSLGQALLRRAECARGGEELFVEPLLESWIGRSRAPVRRQAAEHEDPVGMQEGKARHPTIRRRLDRDGSGARCGELVGASFRIAHRLPIGIPHGRGG
jgi:hypothetical protein